MAAIGDSGLPSRAADVDGSHLPTAPLDFAAVFARRPLILVCILALAIGLAACGAGTKSSSAGGQQSGIDVADANNNGGYVFAGPITYQLQISRELNPYSVEDSQYVKGLPSGVSSTLTAGQLWYGVFLWAKNQTKRPQTTSDSFEIVDTQGNTYYPIKLNTAMNPFAWTSQQLAPGATEPAPDTVQSAGATQGGLLLFKVSDSVYDNRPLTLYILGSGNQRLGSISLNL
jgi:hypothetical protein